MRRNIILSISVLVLLFSSTSYASSAEDKTSQPSAAEKCQVIQTSEVRLNGSDWKLGSFKMGLGERQSAYLPSFNDSDFRTVSVPGEVQVQLGFHGMSLFHQDRELTFVNEKEWWYRKAFVVPVDYKEKNVRILFEGVDYFCSVWLNGEKIGDHEGCFVPFSFDVSSKLHYGQENCLAIKVTCPWVPSDGRGFLEYMKGDWALTFDGTPEFLQFPFPPYRLGPYFTEAIACGNAAFPMGLFRDVRLVASEAIVVDHLFVQTKRINPDGSADLDISGAIINHSGHVGQIKLELKISPENFEGREIELPAQSLNVQPGENRISAQATVKSARLWWTWDTGDQNLYKLTANIAAGAAAGADSGGTVFGIRIIERKSDMSYYLNGKRLFLKGGWFPSGSYFLSIVTRSDYEKDLELFKAANLNLLVAFTIVENADFFDLCDRLGILEFFEFPICQTGPLEVLHPEGPDVAWRDLFVLSLPTPHPRREVYVEESLRQIGQIMIQLRNHPSIVLWAPFAEVGEDAYVDYTKKVRKIVEELAPGTIFHPSFCDAGEKHFWNGATFPLEYFGGYQDQFEANAQFISEYGCIALPAYETLCKMMTPEQMWSRKNMQFTNVLDIPIDVPAYSYYITWEYSGLHSALSKIKDFVDQHPRTLQEFIDDSQLYQAFILKYSTESFRRKKYNSINGMRIWSYREFTPGIRFSFVDYFHVPKMGYFYLKRAQQPFAISLAYKEALEPQPARKKLTIPIWIINDYRTELPVAARCEIFDLKGRQIFSHDFSATVGTDSAKQIGVLEWMTPEKSGIYVLRSSAVVQGPPALTAQETTFIKVVSPERPNVPRKEILPTEDLLNSLRVLLIGQKKYSDPIAEWLTSLNIRVDVVKEETISKFKELSDAEAIHKKYDIVWLTSFASLWKLMDDDIARSLATAIKNGTGFIHTGGEGSFHGGNGNGALIEARALAEALPVSVHGSNDVIYGWFANLNDIKLAVSKAKGWPEDLKQAGLFGLNDVELKPDSRQIMTVSGRPLLVSGDYGKGRTMAFAGFTPSKDQKVMPAAYARLFSRMLVEVGPQTLRSAYSELARQYEPGFESSEPLFENLKDLPEASLQLPSDVAVTFAGRRAKAILVIISEDAYARLVRLRVQWEKTDSDVPFVIFSDNYFDLLAKERKSVELEMLLPNEKMGNITGSVIIEGPNIETRQIPISLHNN